MEHQTIPRTDRLDRDGRRRHIASAGAIIMIAASIGALIAAVSSDAHRRPPDDPILGHDLALEPVAAPAHRATATHEPSTGGTDGTDGTGGTDAPADLPASRATAAPRPSSAADGNLESPARANEAAERIHGDRSGNDRPAGERPAGERPNGERPVDSSFIDEPNGTPMAHLRDPICLDGTGAADLTDLFEGDRTLIGADYQRAYPLPSGRVLWLFQDAFLRTSHGPELVHNVGLLQSGHCFQLLHDGPPESPRPLLFPDLTERFDRWFWPLGGEIGADGRLHVFVAEIRERGPGYLRHTEPVATWLVTIDPTTLAVTNRQLAPDPSPDLYGWSVVSYGDHTYLYAHCYRQFGWDLFPFADPPFRAHDWGCAARVTVARVPRGDMHASPDYWDGATWSDDPTSTEAVFPTENRTVNPVQVGVLDGQLVSATKVDDWWGSSIHLDVAPEPQGPWQTYATIRVAAPCDGCNTYFASIVPFGATDESFMIGLSNNTWGGHDLGRYRPTFGRVPGPHSSLDVRPTPGWTIDSVAAERSGPD